MKFLIHTKQGSKHKSGGRLRVWRSTIIASFLAVIIILLALTRPWQNAQNSQIIETVGQGTVTAAPDEYVFRAVYESKNTDEQTARNMADKKHQELLAQLDKLGVIRQNIKANMQRTERPLRDGINDETTYTLILSVTIQEQYQAKVHEYLNTIQPTGQISQYLQFSEQKRKTIESQAIALATKNARAKAEQSAQGLGLRVGGVKKISDGYVFGYPTAWDALDTSTKYNTVLHFGENDITYNVMATFSL
jgi:uncharacterized protein YggE